MLLNKPYSTKDVGVRYGVDAHTIGDWIRKGCPTPEGRVFLPARKFGRGWKIYEEDLVLFEHRLRRSASDRPRLDLGPDNPTEENTK